MNYVRRFHLVLLVAVLVIPPTIASAKDQPPLPEDRIQIEMSLRDAGYTSWEEIKFDDGVWEVDDARKTPAGPKFDLKLDPHTYNIVQEREDR